MKERIPIGVNGLGTIGRELLAILDQNSRLEVVAVNDVAPVESLVSHLRRQRGWPLRRVDVNDGILRFEDQQARLFQEPEPARIPWREVGVELVIEASGRFTSADRARQHLDAGARQVLVTAPSKGAEATIVRGITDASLSPTKQIVSAGSCTTNCVAPLLHALGVGFGIEWGGFVSVHAATNDQSMVGAPGREPARSFATLDNAFATATGASRAVEQVLPSLVGRLDARAVRVPLSCGSRIELWAVLGGDTTAEQVLDHLRGEMGNGLAGILAVSPERLSAADIRGSSESCIVEAPALSVLGGRHLMVSAWYDNVVGFSHRVVEIVEQMAEHARWRLQADLAAVASC